MHRACKQLHLSTLIAAIILPSCLSKRGPEYNRLLEASLPSDFDFTGECGISKTNIANPDFEIFADTYRSSPIKLIGTSTGVSFRVVTTAIVNINSTVSETTQRVSIRVDEAIPTSTGILSRMASSKIKTKADEAATNNSGTVIAKSVPLAEWVNLNTNNPSAFNGVICGGIGTSEIQIAKGQSSSIITYSPAVIFQLNPNASLKRLMAEFPEERTFQLSATASGSNRDIIQGTQSGTQTIRPIDPNIEINGTKVTADAAWEISFSFPKGAHTVGLPSRQAYYIDNKNKTFSLITTQSDKRDETTGEPLPVAYLLRVGE